MVKKIVYSSGVSASFFILLALISLSFGAYAQEISAEKKEVFSSTGLPIPRYVSLSKQITNVRAGPGQQYPIRWVYKKQGYPVEVILEYDHWRKIRDYEGSEGWVYKTLLSGRRTALIMGDDIVRAYDRNPVEYPRKAKVAIALEPLLLVSVNTCDGAVCYIEASDLSGWIERKSLWGVYETEKFN